MCSRERMTVDGCLSHPWIKNSESQGGVINKEGLSEFQAQYKLKVGLKNVLPYVYVNIHAYLWYKLEHAKYQFCTSPKLLVVCFCKSLYNLLIVLPHRVDLQPPGVQSYSSPCCLYWRADRRLGSDWTRTQPQESCLSQILVCMESIWIRSPGLTGSPGKVLYLLYHLIMIV